MSRVIWCGRVVRQQEQFCGFRPPPSFARCRLRLRLYRGVQTGGGSRKLSVPGGAKSAAYALSTLLGSGPDQTLKITPAMATGVTSKLWEMSDMVQVLDVGSVLTADIFGMAIKGC
jgi:hypothetical protein